ncbi:hypothetical protein ACG2LH_05655 [Zhouia sp. PK063]|uniref:hypothetical protein n=1 Tax=Zhouia sp. PK063 TaxID=3373602 RepID=UPI0037B9863E
MKRILGIVCIIIGFILVLAMVGNIVEIVKTLLKIPFLFSGKMTGYEEGMVMGSFVYWIIHIVVIIILMKVGIRLSKQKKKEII